MKTIVYKKLFNKYRITKIQEGNAPELTLRFEEPIEAKLFIGEAVFTVSCGTVTIPTKKLCDGEISPKLYTGGGKEDIESFTISCGKLLRTTPDSEYVKCLGEAVESISERLNKHEDDISTIKSRLDQKLRF